MHAVADVGIARMVRAVRREGDCVGQWDSLSPFFFSRIEHVQLADEIVSV